MREWFCGRKSKCIGRDGLRAKPGADRTPRDLSAVHSTDFACSRPMRTVHTWPSSHFAMHIVFGNRHRR
jgi:hypothetical protein